VVTKKTALYCPTCGFYNTNIVASHTGFYSSPFLQRHGKICQGQIMEIENPMPDQEWKNMNTTINYIVDEMDDEENSTMLRYANKTLGWIKEKRDAYLEAATPINQGITSGKSLAEENRL
jgi:hypothetical protein